MSSARQAVVRGPSFTGAGKRPVRTPSHQVDLLTGMIGGEGGFVAELPMIWRNRRNPVSGIWWCTVFLRQIVTEEI